MTQEQFSQSAQPGQHGNSPVEVTPQKGGEESAAPSESRSEWPDLPTSGTFVGRQDEVNAIRAALQNSASGQGQMVMLAGEPGIGKTRTAQEAALIAALSGVRVLWGHCYEEQGAPPYWPWIQVIRSCGREQDPGQLRSEMGALPGELLEIVPELQESLPDLKPGRRTEDPREARFRLFVAIASFLKNAAQAQPLMLVLDNLHAADRDSVRLLEFLMQELLDSRILIIGTYRDNELTTQHPLALCLGELVKWPNFQRFTLRGLSKEDVGNLIELTCGLQPPDGLVRTVHAQTQGNPLFVTEILRLLIWEGDLNEGRLRELQARSIRLPEGVRQVINRRLSRLSEECNEVLLVASVLGREFSLELLSRVADGKTAAQTLEALDEAVAAQVIQEQPSTVHHFLFTHALIQQTLYDQTPPGRRTQLHARAGEALEEVHATSLSGHAAELAYHFANAQPILGAEKPIRYNRMAGEIALEIYAYEEALTYFEKALAVKENQPVDEETALLLTGIGRARAATAHGHQMQESVLLLKRAFEYYAQSGDIPKAVAVAESPIQPGPGYTQLAELLGQALQLVPPDSPEAGRLQARYGLALHHEQGDYEAGQAAFARALAIARREGDTLLEVRTLSNSAEMHAYHLRWRECLNDCELAIELARRVNEPRAEFVAQYWSAFALLLILGKPEEELPHIEANLALADVLRHRYHLSRALLVSASQFSLKGDWDAARQFTDRSLRVIPEEARILVPRIALEYTVGNDQRGEALLGFMFDALGRSPPGATELCAGSAVTFGVVSRMADVPQWLSDAKEAGQSVLSSPRPTPFFAALARVGLGLIAVRENDVDSAAEHYGALVSLRNSFLVVVAIDSVLGLLAQTMQRLDNSAAHFEDALAFCRRAGYQPELARSCHEYAGTLLQRGGPGDHEKARTLLNEAYSISSELGMHTLEKRITALREEVEARPVVASKTPHGLTPREVEVLRLVASGKSNPEIGEALHISLNTVKRHLANIFSRTASANRAEAATYAARHNLL